MELCVPIPFGSENGDLGGALGEAALVWIGNDRDQGSCAGVGAEADIFCDASAAGARLGIRAANVDTFTLAGVNAATVVVPEAGAKFEAWIVPAEPLPDWSEAKLWTGCAGELTKESNRMTGRMGRAPMRKTKSGFAPGAFLAELFAGAALAGTAGFPGCAGELEGNARAGTAV